MRSHLSVFNYFHSLDGSSAWSGKIEKFSIEETARNLDVYEGWAWVKTFFSALAHATPSSCLASSFQHNKWHDMLACSFYIIFHLSRALPRRPDEIPSSSSHTDIYIFGRFELRRWVNDETGGGARAREESQTSGTQTNWGVAGTH